MKGTSDSIVVACLQVSKNEHMILAVLAISQSQLTIVLETFKWWSRRNIKSYKDPYPFSLEAGSATRLLKLCKATSWLACLGNRLSISSTWFRVEGRPSLRCIPLFSRTAEVTALCSIEVLTTVVIGSNGTHTPVLPVVSISLFSWLAVVEASLHS